MPLIKQIYFTTYFNENIVAKLDESINLGNENVSMITIPVLIIVKLNDQLYEYGLEEDECKIINEKVADSLVFFGGEWKLFQDEICQQLGTYLPWHLISELYTDVNLTIVKDFNKNKIKSIIHNNEINKKFTMVFDDYETMYQVTKDYISLDYMLNEVKF
jgi:hypothetical protein